MIVMRRKRTAAVAHHAGYSLANVISNYERASIGQAEAFEVAGRRFAPFAVRDHHRTG